MGDLDPFKVVAVFENLFGPKLGRIVATLLLAAACLWGVFFFGDGIWEHGGKTLFDKLAAISLPSVGVTLDNIESVIATILFILVIYSSILLFILVFFSTKIFKKTVSQTAIDGLALLRKEGINTVYAVVITDKEGFQKWNQTKQEWETRLREHLEKNFPKADFLFASELGVVDFRSVNLAFSEEHQRELCYVIRQLDIIEQILNSYRR